MRANEPHPHGVRRQDAPACRDSSQRTNFGTRHYEVRHTLVTLVSVLGLILLLLSRTAEAGMVYGSVTCESCGQTKGEVLVFLQSNKEVARVTVDSAGSYSLVLDPGTYTVRLAKDPIWTAEIRTTERPLRQDIHLRKKGDIFNVFYTPPQVRY
jgi:hypothetical protein